MNGATLEVTYDKALDTSVDTSELLDHFSVQGTNLSGGNRNAYQHPSNASFSAGNNQKLVLTLGDPTRAGDTVTLTYKLEAHTGPLKDTSSNMAPTFIELAVTNNTAGTPGPAPSRASVKGRTLRLVFDGDLDEDSTPAGNAFLVETSDLDYDHRSIRGTGAATVTGAVVTGALDENEDAVGADDEVMVSYTVPSSNPLQNAGGDDVLAFERFRVETVYDGTGPVFAGGEAMQTSFSPDVSKVVIYFDEPLDTGPCRRPGTHDPDHKVDWQVEPPAPSPPTATGVAVSSSPAADDTYKLGETIRVRVTFDEAVDVTGSPRLQIDMDPAGWGEQWAPYESGSGTASLTFAHTVVEPNASTQGIAVLANSLALNGGTIRSTATEADAELAHAGLDHDPAHKVDWEPEAVTVTGVVVSSSPPRESTYVLGDTIRIQADFNGAVDVTGAPRLKLKMDPGYGEKWVNYEAGSGSSSLTFGYEVVEPNNSPNGIAVLANSLALNGGTIEASSGASVDLAHTGLGHDPNHTDLAGNEVANPISEPAENLTTAAMSAADTRVEEAEGATLDFVVSLDVIEDALSLDGDVRTTMVGADYARGPLTLGLSVGRTLGLGGYSGPSGGRMSTSMTGFYPWAGYQVSDRVSVWGVTGYGTGALSLTPDGAWALETGMSMAMTAVGTRGELIGSRATGGFALAFKADALWVGAASELLDGPTGRLNASEAGVTRVRTGLEGSRGFTLVGGRLSLTPSVEVGLRRDGGDAETGAGMDVGGGLAFTDAVTGLSLDVRVRTLVVHQADGFSERGMSLSFGWDPTPSRPLGLTAKVAPSWGGQATGGAEALWSNQMAYGTGSHQMYGGGDRVDAEVGYGLPVGARFVGTPRVGLTTSPYGRDYRFGYGLRVLDQGKVSFELGVDAQRRESATAGGARNGLLGRATLGW